MNRPEPDVDAKFLSRWSARKRTASGAAVQPATLDDDPARDSEPSSSAAERVPPRDRPDAGTVVSESVAIELPPIESLDQDSDLSVFFAEQVPRALKKAALRRVFALPKYNVRDRLDDYDDDYTNFEPLGDTVTADMRYRADVAARRERAALAARVESDSAELSVEPVDEVAAPVHAGDDVQPAIDPDPEQKDGGSDPARDESDEAPVAVDDSTAPEHRHARSADRG